MRQLLHETAFKDYSRLTSNFKHYTLKWKFETAGKRAAQSPESDFPARRGKDRRDYPQELSMGAVPRTRPTKRLRRGLKRAREGSGRSVLQYMEIYELAPWRVALQIMQKRMRLAMDKPI